MTLEERAKAINAKLAKKHEMDAAKKAVEDAKKKLKALRGKK